MESANDETTDNREARRRGNRIQVSTSKKSLYFYVNLAKRLIQQHDEILLSALGMAISTAVIISEILKNSGLATEKNIRTSTVESKDNNNGRIMQKPKIEIVLQKLENKFNDQMTVSTHKPGNAAEVDDCEVLAASEQECSLAATSEEESGVTTTGSEEDSTGNTPKASAR